MVTDTQRYEYIALKQRGNDFDGFLWHCETNMASHVIALQMLSGASHMIKQC